MYSSCRAFLYPLGFYIGDDLSHTALNPLTLNALTPWRQFQLIPAPL